MAASDTLEIVPDGYRLGGSSWERRQHASIRRLAASVYWVEALGAQSTVVIADGAALIIDPHEGARTQCIAGALDDLGGAVTAIAYTHHHADHIGGAGAVVNAQRPHRQPVTVLSTPACDDQVRRRGVAPPATRLLEDGGYFDFEGVRVDYGTIGGHSPDNTYFLVEGVLHLADTIHPGQAEWEFFGMPSLTEYADTLTAAEALDWRVMTATHGDLGWPSDVALVRRYLEDLSAEVLSAASAIAPEPFMDPQSHGYAWAASRKRAIVDAVVPRLRDDWSRLPGFDEHAWTHVWWMYHQLVILKEPALPAERSD